jgi:cytochrome P450
MRDLQKLLRDTDTRYEDPDRFDVRREAEHQVFGAGGRHFCLGTALARLELRILYEETLRRYPAMELAGAPIMVESIFVNQLKTLPVCAWPNEAVSPAGGEQRVSASESPDGK